MTSLIAFPEEICAHMARIVAAEQLVELRALHVPTDGGPRTFSGFFNDVEALAQAAAKLSGMGATGVYFTPNPLKGGLLDAPGLIPNRVVPATRGALAKDIDVAEVKWLLVDIDPVRESGTSATAPEKAAAGALTRAVSQFLGKKGWPAPLFGDSGNGYHLLYRVEGVESSLIQDVLRVLSFLFDTEQAEIDQKVFNPARIFKIYGTIARKGEDSDLRPWRKTTLLKSSGGTEPVDATFLRDLVSLLPTKGEDGSAPTGALDRYMDKHFPQAEGPLPWGNGGRRWVFDTCPWDPEHTDRSAYVLQFAKGGIAAGCLHKTCDGAKKVKGRSQGWKKLQKLAGEDFGSPITSNPLASTANTPNLTDLGNAKRLVRAFQHELAYCPSHSVWYLYTGKYWRRDDDGAIHRRAKAAVGGIFTEASVEQDTARRKAIHKHALKSESARSLSAMVSLASTEQEVALVSSRLDLDPWMFNVQNGTLDLRTGKLHDHDRTDYMTKISPVVWDPEAECPVWEEFLEYAMQGSTNVIDFLHRFFGYCLTGISTEQVLLFMEGTGQNGKTTALLILMYIMGDYAIQGAPGLLMAKRGEAHPTEVADLEGVRFVANAEVEKGKPFAEVLIKQLTGSDKIRARKMRQDFYEFEPTHKLIIAANHRPIIKGNDEGIWRRVLRLPWLRKIEKKDPFFLDKLKAEAPGILRKLVEGCQQWQQDGLCPPAAVQMATAEYREEMDLLAEFLEDCCEVAESLTVKKKTLYLTYTDWCEGFRQKPVGYNLFCRQLSERGFVAQPRWFTQGNVKKSIRVWVGLGLTTVGPLNRAPNTAWGQA